MDNLLITGSNGFVPRALQVSKDEKEVLFYVLSHNNSSFIRLSRAGVRSLIAGLREMLK